MRERKKQKKRQKRQREKVRLKTSVKQTSLKNPRIILSTELSAAHQNVALLVRQEQQHNNTTTNPLVHPSIRSRSILFHPHFCLPPL